MFRRNRLIEQQNSNKISSVRSTQANILSPNCPTERKNLHQNQPSRFQRRGSKEQNNIKSSSLNSRLKRKRFQQKYETKNTVVDKQHFENVKQSYYPDDYRHPQSTQYLPILDKDTVEFQQKEQQSVSTQLSKRESYQLENTQFVKIRGVKFSEEVVESNTKNVDKKKENRTKSPSILKNGRNILNASLLINERSFSIANSAASNKKQRREKSIQNSKANAIVKQKYKSILSRLETDCETMNKNSNKLNQRFSSATYSNGKGKKNNIRLKSSQKYKDQLFPPVYSSLFSMKKGRPKIGEEIVWMRISDLFSDQKCILANPEDCSIKIYIGQMSYCSQYLAGAFNCIKNNGRLLQKIFENQQINEFGIYILKIFQQSSWKYIIIDDYIPVMRNKSGKLIPAFVQIEGNDNKIDIWPFLLQKAYANYYASYEALQCGSIVDFIEEVSGIPSQVFQFKPNLKESDDNENTIKEIIRQMKTGQAIAFAKTFDNQNYPLYYKPQYCYNITTEQQLTYFDKTKCYQPIKIKFAGLPSKFKFVYVINSLKYTRCNLSTVKKNKKLLQQKGSNQSFSKDIIEPEIPSLRYFKLLNGTQCSISIRQKQKRFFHFNNLYKEYMWNRVILLQKEYNDDGYRWINGSYSNQKSINFNQYLEAGEYYLIIMPEWQSVANQISIFLYTNNICQIERKVYNIQDQLIEKGCTDLAQRFGQLNQINKFLCSYNYVGSSLGLIIENIVNQRLKGNVTVVRSIRGLKCKVIILPVNRIFYQQFEENGTKMWKLNEDIEFDISTMQHFTVVLKLKGGIDHKFFKSFDFGG